MSKVSSAQIARTARIVATGRVTSKGDIYSLIAALRNVDAKLPRGWPLMIHLEDFTALEQFGGEFELSAELLRIKRGRELFSHVQDSCIGTAPLTALLYADQRTANKVAAIGGFGDAVALIDSSGLAAKDGRTVRVIKAGEFKGAGTPGTVLTPEQLDVLSKPVIESVEIVLNELVSLRRWDAQQTAEIKSGKVFIGDDLTRLRLIKNIATAEEAFAMFTTALEKKHVPK